MYRLILIFFLLLVVYWLIRRTFASKSTKEVSPKDGSEEMVQDPVCKCYVPKSQSYSLSFQGQKLHFCSEECIRKYMASHSLPKG